MKPKRNGVGFVRQLAVWILILIFTTQPVLAATEVVADPANGKNPGVQIAPNGKTTIVQILAPNASGLSHNQYLNLQVGADGIIYNNGVGLVNTKLAGWITGNPNLRGGSARIILNEVTGNLPTNLNGFQEVAGNKATLILANPNGIVGNGFGFINVNRGVLTTGTPLFGGSGSLEAFRVTGGQIAVNGTGLDASGADRVDLIARAVQLNAQLNAKEINIVTGANQVNYATNQAASINADPTDVKPAVALDVSALGGMYANKITLVGTESGVGVNSQGTMQASGDIQLNQAGQIILAGNTTAGGNAQINGQSDIENHATFYAGGSAAISGNALVKNSGTIAAAQHTTIAADQIVSSGVIGAGVQKDGSISGNGNLSIMALSKVDAQGKTIAAGDTAITAGVDIKLGGNHLTLGQLNVNGASIDQRGASVMVGGDVSLTAAAGSIDNTDSTLQANGNVTIQAVGTLKNDNVVTNSAAKIVGKKVMLSANEISNRGGTIESNTDLKIDVQQMNNQNGTVQASTGQVSIMATQGTDNSGGKITGQDVILQQENGALNNTDGQISATKNLQLTASNVINANGSLLANKDINVMAGSVSNNGKIMANQDLRLTLQGDFTNQAAGRLKADRNLTLSTNGNVMNQGNLEAADTLNISGANIANESNATISATKTMTIMTGNNLNNAGNISGDTLVFNAGQNLSNTGSIMAGTLTVTADSMSNSGATAIVATTGDTNLYVRSSLENKDSANLYTLNNLNIAGSANKDSATGLYTDKTGSILNQSATIEATKDITIQAGDITNKKREFAFEQRVVSETRYDQRGIRPPTPGDRWEDSWLVFWRYTSAKLLGSDRGAIPSDWLISETVSQPFVTKDSPAAQIKAGRNMELQAANLTNSMSNILAGETLHSVTTNFTNTDSQYLARITTKKILTVFNRQQYENQERDFARDHDDVSYETIPGFASVVGGGQNVSVNTVNINNNTVVPTGVDVVTAINASTSPAVVAQNVRNQTTNMALPASALYTIHKEADAQCLVETNPRFTQYQSFISSDYLTNSLIANAGVDPKKVSKRLGDGFYEQKLVRDQISQLTGRVFLQGYNDTNEEYKALLTNGETCAKELKLTLGIALSAEQMEKLTSDMVWLVEKEVDGQKVLVPQVYLAQDKSKTLTTNGALIAANNVQIKASGDLNNNGAILADKQLIVDETNNIRNTGVLTGKELVRLDAKQDISNQSGTISGREVTLTAGRDIKNETVAVTDTQDILMRTTVQNIASIKADKGLTINAKQDVIVSGATLSAKEKVDITAGRDLNVSSVKTEYKIDKSTTFVDVTQHVTSDIKAGTDLAINANGDASLKGALLQAGKDIKLTAEGDVNISAVKDQQIVDKTIWKRDDYTRTRNVDESITGSLLLAGNNLSIESKKGNVAVTASQLSATGNADTATTKTAADETGTAAKSKIGGDIKITAGKNISIQDAKEVHESLVETHTVDSGFFSTTTTDTRDQSYQEVSRQSGVKGSNINIGAGWDYMKADTQQQGNLTAGKADVMIQGSSVLAEQSASVSATHDVTIQSGQDTASTDHYFKQETSGIFGSGGLGFTIGSRSEKLKSDRQIVTQVASTVGTTAGKTVVNAGHDANVISSNVVGDKGVEITANQNVNIIAANDSDRFRQSYEFKQSGLSVSLGGGLVSGVQNTVNTVQSAANAKDSRLQSLEVWQAGKQLKDLGDKLNGGWANARNDATNLNISISIGSQRLTTQSESQTNIARGSVIDGGTGDVTAKAGTGDLNVIASTVSGNNVKLDAEKGNVNLLAGENTSSEHNSSSSSSASIGVSIGLKDGFKGGITPTASFSRGTMDANGNIITHTDTLVSAKENLAINSGNDTNLVGAKASGDKIVATVGGNLNLVSLQDSDTYHETSNSVGIDLSLGKKLDKSLGAGVQGPVQQVDSLNATGSLNRSKMDSDYNSVAQQTGIYAGKDGFDIQVGKNTDLKGAVIASDAMPDKNKLSTGTLTYSDIQNKAEYNASSSGVSISMKDGKISMPLPTPSMPVSGTADSKAKSAISPGTIIVGGKEVNPEGLSRDPSGSLNALGKIFDKKTVQERQELANLFGQEAFNAIGDLALNQYKNALKEAANYKEGTPEYNAAMANANSWKDGGSNKIFLHTIAGGIMSSLAGNGFSSGAISAGLNETIQNQLANIKDTGLHQLLSGALGAAAAKVAGGNAQVGAVTALYGTKYNWLNHYQQQELVYQLSLVDNDNDRAYLLAKYQALSEYNIEKHGAGDEAIEPELYDALSKFTYLSNGGLNYNLSVLTEKYGSNIDIEKYKNELRTIDIPTTISRNPNYEGLSPERQKTLSDYFDAQTPTDKLLLGAKFLGQGWLEPITAYRDSQYQLMIANGIPEDLAAVGADQMTVDFAGSIVGMAIKTGDVVGSGLGNLQKVFSSEEVANAYQGIRIINRKYAGQVYNLEGSLANKYPNGVRFTEEGFPDFAPYAEARVRVSDLKGNTGSDFTAANKAAGFSETPAGFTWHHAEDGQTMFLVPTELHTAIRHTGGAALLRNGRVIAYD